MILHGLLRQALRAGELAYYQVFLGPRGRGLPVAVHTWDSQYRKGHWDIFETPDELPRYAIIAAYIRNYSVAPTILDVGCGYGRLLAELQPSSVKKYLGIDLSSEAISRAKACDHPHVSFEVADFTEWRTDSKFDIIVFNETLYYATYTVPVLDRYFDMLDEHGSIIVSMYRHRNTKLIWRDIGRRFAFIDSFEVKNGKGEITDIRVLMRPGRPACFK